MKRALALTVALLALYAAVYAVGAFSGTYVSGTVRDPAIYQWTGDTIAVQRKAGARGCTVTPDGGAEEAVEIGSSKGAFGAVTELRPWFPGGAMIKCQGGLTVWTGRAADLRLITRHPLFFTGASLLISVPILLLVIRRRRNQPARNP
ncbi:hypothetical protein SAMN05192558_113209 [Actinokineospora alba]|uniref:Uncharacterized protein n=1 Tax=Actinokineospora alba TaxID=504798 RepID=A0A1H0VDP8_9PSEU|nr:hypothetical protein [Actinokineospora alba]TDP65656.1 hypothetical protein C8E96_1143 [Actinokineospora alba]SDH67651.1 hypothetical protein SAMN05421871_101963 [Actinokineospora alba]SDP76471.1 hypothetical protein SAMN05192558_113209 [Actinokineospora alba]